MDLNSKEVYYGFIGSDGVRIEFYKLYDAADFEHVGGSPEAKKAWETCINLKLGLEANRVILTTDHLLAIKSSLFGRFADLGVPSDMIQPLVASFQYVQDMLNRKTAN